MEYRKIIKFGNSSFVVSVPKTWISKNKLSKGDVVSVHENGNNELLVRRPINDEQKVKIREKTITVDGQDPKKIKRDITNAYIQNYHIISIEGKELDKNVRDVRKFLSNFMALEVVEQTTEKIVARDFLNMKKISLKGVIQKIDGLVRSMITDSRMMLERDSYHSIMVRDDDVNRMVNLILRVGRYALQKPQLLDNTNMQTFEMYRYLHLADTMEKVADEAKRIASVMREMSDSKVTKQLNDTYEELENFYRKTMDAYYAEKADVDSLVVLDRDIIRKCDALVKKEQTTAMARVTEMMKCMASHVQSIVREVSE